MTPERPAEGLVLRLKPRGIVRFISSAFLGVWLCGWAVGETFVLWMLLTGALSLLTGRPPEPGREPLQLGPTLVVGAFLLVWLISLFLGFGRA